jgi:hypothetical protein
VLRSVHHVADALTSENIYDVLIDFPMDDFPIPQRILSSNTFTPYFDGCISALDGTHLPVHVSEARCTAFCNRKGVLSQNILAVYTMNMQFLYVMAGWEGSASDSHVFEDALRKGFAIPKGCYYLADAGYANCDVLLVPYWGVCYHLREWGMGNEWCIYLIFPSHAIVDLCHLGPGTTRNSSTFGMHNSGMSLNASSES